MDGALTPLYVLAIAYKLAVAHKSTKSSLPTLPGYVYVTDGAAMTSASCVNPSLTYMALTARAADHAVKARKRGDL